MNSPPPPILLQTSVFVPVGDFEEITCVQDEHTSDFERGTSGKCQGVQSELASFAVGQLPPHTARSLGKLISIIPKGL